jgi:ATP/ADP translocase
VIDAVIAAILTILVVVLSPGWAIVGLIAVLLVLVCGVSFAISALRNRSRERREPEQLNGSPSRFLSGSRSPTRRS